MSESLRPAYTVHEQRCLWWGFLSLLGLGGLSLLLLLLSPVLPGLAPVACGLLVLLVALASVWVSGEAWILQRGAQRAATQLAEDLAWIEENAGG